MTEFIVLPSAQFDDLQKTGDLPRNAFRAVETLIPPVELKKQPAWREQQMQHPGTRLQKHNATHIPRKNFTNRKV